MRPLATIDSLEPEQQAMLSDRLDKLGLEGSAWKEPIMERMAKDLQSGQVKDEEFKSALDKITSSFKVEILVDLPKISPRTKAYKIYRTIRRAGQIGAVVMIGLSIIAFAFSLGIGIPLIMTGLFLFLFVVFPFTFLIRNIRDRIELVYTALFPGE
jgi:hypothetical protein